MSIVWTVLPDGIQGGQLRLSLFVSPRLDGPTLAGTAFESWPTTLSGLLFQLVVDPGPTSFLVFPAAGPDATLWSTIFPPSTPVSPFTYTDLSDRPLWSYPVRRVAELIEGVYAWVQASTPTSFPSVDRSVPTPLTAAIELVEQMKNRRLDGRHYEQVRRAPSRAGWIAAALGEQAVVAGLPADAQAMYLAQRFHDRPASALSKDDQGYRIARARPTKPSFDFHQKLSVLADHPYLLRRLGLVLDVALDPALQLPASGFIKVNVLSTQGLPVAGTVSPRTAYRLVAGSSFQVATRATDEELADGFLALEKTTSFFVSQGEPDGDVEKLTNFASNVVRLSSALTREAGTTTAGPPEPLPARRTTGLYVVRSGRQAALKARFAANAGLNATIASASPADLYADDVLRGYRVDVKTSSSRWSSLMRRRVTYTVGTGPSPTVIVADHEDEGYVKAASASSDDDPTGPPDLYVHEMLLGWEGVSLVAPRPGRRLMPVYANPEDAIATPDVSPDPDFPVSSLVRAVPRSLIPLRFGYPYAFRVRAVDLAGNSLPFTAPDASPTHATPLVRYKRYEPLPPPAMVIRHVLGEGESVEHLVIRSADGVGAATYAATLNGTYADPAFPAKVYRATCERHVAVPKTSQAMAEAHGDFDGAFMASADLRAFFRLGTREEGTFSDKRIPSLTTDGYIDGNPNQAAIITPPQVPMDQRRGANGGPQVSSLTEKRGDPLAPGEYVVCGAADAVLPYLPDSAAGGFVLFDPQANAVALAVPWAGTWPDWQPIRLQLAEGATVQVGPLIGRLATVTLPPATILTLHYASTVAADRRDHFQYVLDYGVTAAQLAGARHWMITPCRELTLVHAVPRPLAPPRATLTLSRQQGDTFVSHTGPLSVHSRSTGHVDLEATWQETIDDVTKPLPDDGVSSPTLPQSGHAYQVPVTYGADAPFIQRLKHEFTDTRHRRVTYTPVAHTRYKEYFPPALVADAALISLAGTAPGPLTGGAFSVPSSVRPPVPRLVSVVPTFAWEAGAGKRTRKGGGLRVYLERPWYVSGEGELVAVLLPAASSAPSEQVSRWGRDPLWAAGTRAPLKASDFVAPLRTATGLTLPSGEVVDVVAYGVEFNAARRLWFCDIELEPALAYFPFVSLMLSRYQPESLRTLELSAPVRAEFGQLAADRTLEFSVSADAVQVTVTGVAAPNAADPSLPEVPLPAMQVSPGNELPAPRSHHVVGYVQERTPGAVGDIGWTTVTPLTLLPGSRPGGLFVTRWTGRIALPAASGKERRVVIEERELYLADPAGGAFNFGTSIGERVVYVDTIALT